MARETKIGLLAIISIGLVVWGFMFLKGKNLLTTDKVFYAVYDNVDQLLISNPVLINGYQVGLVTAVYQQPSDLQKIVIEMTVNKSVKLPKNTAAEIITTSVMGGKAVNLVYEGTCLDSDCAASGDTLIGVTRDLITSMVGVDNLKSIFETIEKVNALLDTITGQATTGDGSFQTSISDIQGILGNLNSTTARLDRLMATSTGSITNSLKNVESITGNLQENNGQIASILANVDSLSAQLKEADLGATVKGANATIEQLQGSLTKIDEAVKGLNDILNQLKTDEGTLGMLINDKELYDNLNSAIKNVELLMQDVRLHPKRYTRILSKKEKPYEKPEDDPAFEGGEGDN